MCSLPRSPANEAVPIPCQLPESPATLMHTCLTTQRDEILCAGPDAMNLASGLQRANPALTQPRRHSKHKHKPNINEALPAELLSLVLGRVSMKSGSFHHALVCQTWLSLGHQVQLKMKLRDGARLAGPELTSAVKGFHALRSFRLTDCSVQVLTDSLMEELSGKLQGLKQLHLETFCSVEKPVLSPSGLSSLVDSSPGLVSCTLSFADEMQLPGNFHSLSSLRLLELKNVSYLPDSLASLTSLVHLILWHDAAMSGLAVIFQLTGLRKLSLNILELERIPAEVRLLKNLRNLEVFSTLVSELPGELFSLTRLKRLHLRCNMLREIPDKQVQQLKLLEVLEIPACSTLNTLPPSLPSLPNLRAIEGGHALSSLPAGMEGFRKLQALKLSFLEDGDKLPRGISSLAPTLRSLSFECCGLLRNLPEDLLELTGLEHLSLDFCIELASLPERIGQFKNLTKLELVGLPELSALPESMGGLHKLQELVLSSLDSLTSLPMSLFGLRGVRSAHINMCPELRVPCWQSLCQPWRGFVEAFHERSLKKVAIQRVSELKGGMDSLCIYVDAVACDAES